MWINAIRLSFWERSRCNEIWTGSLLGVREPRPLGWQGYDVGLPAPHSAGSSADGGRKASAASGRFEGWLKARLPGDTEWRRVWAVVVRGSSVPSRASVVGGPAAVAPAEEKKSRRTSLLSFGKKDKKADEIAVEELPGGGAVSTLAFYDRKPGKKEQPLCVAQHIYYGASSSSLRTLSAQRRAHARLRRSQPPPSTRTTTRSSRARPCSRSRARSSAAPRAGSRRATASAAGPRSRATPT